MEDFLGANHTLGFFLATPDSGLSVPKDKVELHHLFLSDHVMSFFHI